MQKIFIFTLFLFSSVAQAGLRFELGGGYHYSRLEYKGNASTFSLLSNAGYYGQGEIGIGTKKIELFGFGNFLSESYLAPNSRTINDSDVNIAETGGGVRYLMGNVGIALKYTNRPFVYLEDLGSNTYNLSTGQSQLVVGNLQISAREKTIGVLVELEAAYPIASEQVNDLDTTITRAIGANARVNVGNKYMWSLYGGFRTYEYKSTSDNYFGFDFFAGAVLSVAFSFGGKGSKASEIPYNYWVPSYPL